MQQSWLLGLRQSRRIAPRQPTSGYRAFRSRDRWTRSRPNSSVRRVIGSWSRYAPSEPLRKQIDAGEPFDVVLIFPNVVDDLIRQGKVAAGTRVDIARAGLGLAVRKGAAKPDIRSIDGFKRALLTSKSIAYAAQGPSGVHLAGVLERLGIAQDVRPKLKPVGAGSLVVGPVASGDVEIGIVSIPFILAERRCRTRRAASARAAGLCPVFVWHGSCCAGCRCRENICQLFRPTRSSGNIEGPWAGGYWSAIARGLD